MFVESELQAVPQEALQSSLNASTSLESFTSEDEEISLDVTKDDIPKDEDHRGQVVMATGCKLIAPSVVVPGNLTITTSAVYFAVDEDNEEYKRLDPNVSTETLD